MKGFTHSDVMNLPVYERRYFLNMLTSDARQRQEKQEEEAEQSKSQVNGNSKGSRTTRVSGDTLKSRMASGSVI